MCGIMGYYAFSEKRPKKKILEKMFVDLESRGDDAAGFAYIDPKLGSLVVKKVPVSSKVFVNLPIWKKLSNLPKIMIFHTRAYTQGKPADNKNNHPLFNKQGLCIVHNGMISNDYELFKNKPRDAEVDSEAILSVMTEHPDNMIEAAYSHLMGSYAVAAINTKDPDKLLLFRHTSPIEIAYDKKDDILYFASTFDTLIDAINPESIYTRGLFSGYKGFSFFTYADNNGMVIGPDGVEHSKEYTPLKEIWTNRYYPAKHKTLDKWEDESWWVEYQKKLDKDRKESWKKNKNTEDTIIWCPSCGEETIYNPISLNNICMDCGCNINSILAADKMPYTMFEIRDEEVPPVKTELSKVGKDKE